MLPLFRSVFPVLETTPQRWIELASKLPPGCLLRGEDFPAFHPDDKGKGPGDDVTPVRLAEESALLHEWAGHDLMHAVQGERAVLQPFIDGCGPWKRYFSDHIVSPNA